MANLRWDAWFGGAPIYPFPSRLAPWVVDYWIVFFFVTARMAWWLRRSFLELPDARKAARVAIGVYLGLLLSGTVLLALVK